jgi:hypothetical protein
MYYEMKGTTERLTLLFVKIVCYELKALVNDGNRAT